MRRYIYANIQNINIIMDIFRESSIPEMKEDIKSIEIYY